MRVFALLTILFTAIPLIELTLLLWLSSVTSVWWTLGLVIFTGMLGAYVARRQGFNIFQNVLTQIRAGKPVADAVLDGVLLLIGGVLLVTPGVLTDVTGMLLLVPRVRAKVADWLSSYFKSRVQIHTHTVVSGFQTRTNPPPDERDVIDAEFRRVE